MDCPSKECREKVNGYHTTLYGEDGLGGLVKEVGRKANESCLRQKYITKPSSVLVGFLLVAFLSFGGTIIKVWSFSENSGNVYADQETVREHKERIALLEQGFETIEEDIGDIKKSQVAQKIEVREAMKEIKKDRLRSVAEIKELMKSLHK
jgi:hypothetical protein